jgi:hypothetical protein
LIVNCFALFIEYNKFYKSVYTSAEIQNTSVSKKRKGKKNTYYNAKVIETLVKHRMNLEGDRARWC